MPPPPNPPDISAELRQCEDSIAQLNEKTGEFKGLKAMYNKCSPLWDDKYNEDKDTLRKMEATLQTTQQEVKDLKRHIAGLQDKAKGSASRREDLEDLIETRKAKYDKSKKRHNELVFTKVYYDNTGKGSDEERRNLEAEMKGLEAKMKELEAKLKGLESELKELEDAPKQLAESSRRLKDAEKRVERQEKEIKRLKAKVDRDRKEIEEVKSRLATDQDRQQNSKKLADAKTLLLQLQKELRKQDEKALGNKATTLELELKQIKKRHDALTTELGSICDNVSNFRRMQVYNKDKAWKKLGDTLEKLTKLSKS
jgi:chromosome segregation ATPase